MHYKYCVYVKIQIHKKLLGWSERQHDVFDCSRRKRRKEKEKKQQLLIYQKLPACPCCMEISRYFKVGNNSRETDPKLLTGPFWRNNSRKGIIQANWLTENFLLVSFAGKIAGKELFRESRLPQNFLHVNFAGVIQGRELCRKNWLTKNLLRVHFAVTWLPGFIVNILIFWYLPETEQLWVFFF